MIGSAEDIERRIQEQLERPKAMFSEDGPVRRCLEGGTADNDGVEDIRRGSLAQCVYFRRKSVESSLAWGSICLA